MASRDFSKRHMVRCSARDLHKDGFTVNWPLSRVHGFFEQMFTTDGHESPQLAEEERRKQKTARLWFDNPCDQMCSVWFGFPWFLKFFFVN